MSIHPHIPRDLGGGLTMRRATPADAEALAAFNADVHRLSRNGEPNEFVAAWTRDLMRGDHPTFDPAHFTLVEESATGRIVSSLNLIPQTWSYAGVEFGVGRPELVGTLPEYRRRGLVRAQFEVIHQWSEERGHRLQAIAGIPYYYRQFGYEMAMDLDGSRRGHKSQVPALKEGEEEAYRVRPAVEADIPFLRRLYAQNTARSLVSCVRDEALWRYELSGRSKQSAYRRDVRIVETAAGDPVGGLIHPSDTWGSALYVNFWELAPGVSWLAVAPGVLRYLKATGEVCAARAGKDPFEELAFALGAQHPLYVVAQERLPGIEPSYAWYVRVPDLPGFLRHVAPVLERRLAASPAAGHTGMLKLSFHRGGVRLDFRRGKLEGVCAWDPASGGRHDAAFPDLTFLQLLFGYRSLLELRYTFPDCSASGDPRVLLEVLFPKLPSEVWTVG